jgi:triosephosphate isomerase
VEVPASSSSRASAFPDWRYSDGKHDTASGTHPLIAGNWKMNLDHLQSIAFVQKLAWSLKDARHDYTEVEVAVFPPFTDLRSVQTLVSADRLPMQFGGQDVSAHASGAYTGEISASLPQGP